MGWHARNQMRAALVRSLVPQNERNAAKLLIEIMSSTSLWRKACRVLLSLLAQGDYANQSRLARKSPLKNFSAPADHTPGKRAAQSRLCDGQAAMAVKTPSGR